MDVVDAGQPHPLGDHPEATPWSSAACRCRVRRGEGPTSTSAGTDGGHVRAAEFAKELGSVIVMIDLVIGYTATKSMSKWARNDMILHLQAIRLCLVYSSAYCSRAEPVPPTTFAVEDLSIGRTNEAGEAPWWSTARARRSSKSRSSSIKSSKSAKSAI